MSLSRRSFLAATGAASLAGIARSETPKGAKFQLGLVTYNVVQSWDLPAILKVCQANGIAAVEGVCVDTVERERMRVDHLGEHRGDPTVRDLWQRKPPLGPRDRFLNQCLH